MSEGQADATMASRPVIYHGAAITDARSDRLRLDVDVIVERGIVVAIEDSRTEYSPRGPAGERVVDARGATIVPGLVDCHSHLTMPGGADWVARATDPDDVQLEVAEHNARLLRQSGVRWARDVGAARARENEGGRARALSLTARDRWRGDRDYPYVRAAGTWLAHASYEALREISISVADGDGLAAAAAQQLDEGADFVKLYMDGPDADTSPFTAGEVANVVALAHSRGAKVTAHTTQLPGARAAVAGGCDALEHGWDLDVDLVAEMAATRVFLVPTLGVLASMRTFATTTSIPRFTTEEGVIRLAERRERAHASVRLAHSHGVVLAVGSDFGGGSLRANQLSWEIESLTELGVPLWEALAGATWRAGDLLGESEAGRIRVGGPADFFLVHGDPLSDARALSRVWRVA
jgi:imidazolonepropionase-like amidohydrolase